MDQALEILFESGAKVKILRLFLQNPEQLYTAVEIKDRCQIKRGALAKELPKLIKARFLCQKIGTIRPANNPEEQARRTGRVKSRKAKLYYLNPEFKLLPELRELIIKSTTTSHKRILSQLKRIGRVKLVLLSGIFINNDTTRTDLFVVGDDIKNRALSRFLQQIESEIGKSIHYTVMDTEEFKYRMNMYDRFLRDILDRPHEKLLNKLHV